MLERSSQLPTNSTDSVSPNDIFGQVMGQEKHGRVRMFGSSVPATDAWGQLPSKNASYRIIHEQHLELQKMKDKLKDQERKFDQQESRIQDLTAAVT